MPKGCRGIFTLRARLYLIAPPGGPFVPVFSCAGGFLLYQRTTPTVPNASWPMLRLTVRSTGRCGPLQGPIERAAFNSKLWEAARRGWQQEISGMHSSLSVFHCRTAQGNRNYETRFQWFNFFRDPEKGLVPAQQANLEEMIRRAKEDY